MTMRASIRSKSSLIIGVGLAILVVLGIVGYQSANRLYKSDQDVQRLLKVRVLLEDVLLGSERAQSAQLRYQFSGAAEDSDEFRALVTHTRTAMKDLGETLRDQGQKDRFRVLERTVAEHFDVLTDAIRVRDKGKSARSWAMSAAHAELTRQILRVGDSIAASESRLLKEQQLRVEGNARLTLTITAWGSVLAIVMLVWLFFVIDRYERDRSRAEQSLRGSKERLDLALEGSQSAFWDWNVKANEIFLGAGWSRMLGAPPRDTTITPEQLLEIVHPDDFSRVQTVVQNALKGRTPEYREEHRVRRSDGQWMWILSLGKVVQRDAQGRPSRMAGINQNITDRKQAEAALQAHDQRLRLALETAVMASWEWNAASDEFIWHDDPGPLAGPAPPGGYAGLQDMVHPEDLVHFIRTLEGAARSDEPYRDEYRITRTDGQVLWVLARGASQHDADGKVSRILGVTQDISDIKRAEQKLIAREQQMRLLTDAVPALIAYADAGETVRFANRTQSRMLGKRLEDIIGHPLREILGDDAYRQSRPFVLRALAGEEVHFERSQMTPRGPLDLSMHYVPHHGERGEVAGFYALGTDITELKRLDRMKSEFVSTVSHELRTPLTSIRGSLSVLSGGLAGALPDKARGFIDIAKNNCERLIRLINDILDIEKIESGKMTFQSTPVDTMELVEQAMRANEGFAAQHKVGLAITATVPGAKLFADSDRLTQVLTNLISNACKFSPAGSSVDIAVTREAGRLRVAVSDHGAGIPEEFQSRIFNKFSQADSSTVREKGGTGLGLSISKAIVEGLGGEIGFSTVTGAPDVATGGATGRTPGTTFFFVLPEWHASQVASAQTASGRPRILVCEDDADVGRLLQIMVDRAGYDSDLARNAAEAMHLARTQRYAAITLDLGLPDQDGLSLLRDLRAPTEGLAVPVIVVSATAEAGRLRLGGDTLGVVDWLSKPIDENRLADILRLATGTGARPRVLHVEDDPDMRNVVATLARDSAAFVAAESLAQARSRLAEERFDLVLLDLGLPDGSGWDLLPLIDSLKPRPQVVIFSAEDAGEKSLAAGCTFLVKSQTTEQQLIAAINAAAHGASQHPAAIASPRPAPGPGSDTP